MLEKMQFWGVLVWMIGMLVMAFVAIRAVWRESERPNEARPDPREKDTPAQEEPGTRRRGLESR
jgi:hypothetical protein